MRIDVTDAHLRQGGTDPEGHPLALAINAALPPGYFAAIRHDAVEIGYVGGLCVLESPALPEGARRFAAAYNAGEPVQAFSFELALEPFLNEGA